MKSDKRVCQRKLVNGAARNTPQPSRALRSAENQPAMIKVGGIWVHHGVPESGAGMKRVLDEVREERIQAVLKTSGSRP